MRSLHAGLWGLAALSLTREDSLQFYLGYPLRALTTHGAALLLSLSGFAVQPEGLCLRWGQRLVCLDAPCSGVQMLWAGLALVLLAATRLRLGARDTLAAAGLGVLAVLAANVLRVASLFFVELSPARLGWMHTGCGLVAFALALAPLLVWMRRRPPAGPQGRKSMLAALLLLACLPTLEAEQHADLPFPGWPTQFEGRALRPLEGPRSELERSFYRAFPGRMGRFTDGERELVVRWVTQPTRRLHPASDCYRGLGYALTPGPLLRDPQRQLWGSFVAERGQERYQIRERIVSDQAAWTDASAWFWDASFGAPGPYWAFTVAARI